MTRPELVRLLAILVKGKRITQAEANEILSQFDAGSLDARSLPLPIAQIRRQGDVAAALLAVALLLGANDRRRLLAGQPLPLFVRRRVREQLQDAFERNVARLAEDEIDTGRVTVWHGAMVGAVGSYVTRQQIAGAGRIPTIAERIALAGILATQMVYLYRFAGEMAVRRATGNPLSSPYIANRAQQYGGSGRAAWFRGSEGSGRAGWVVEYRALDDDRTCGPCSSAEADGPYLPGEGPFPGDVCLGRGRCRCEREEVYNVAAWQRLTGRRLAA